MLFWTTRQREAIVPRQLSVYPQGDDGRVLKWASEKARAARSPSMATLMPVALFSADNEDYEDDTAPSLPPSRRYRSPGHVTPLLSLTLRTPDRLGDRTALTSRQ